MWPRDWGARAAAVSAEQGRAWRRGAASVPPWPFGEPGPAARLGQPGRTPPKPRTPGVAAVFPKGPHARGEDRGPAFPLWQSLVPPPLSLPTWGGHPPSYDAVPASSPRLHSALRRGGERPPPLGCGLRLPGVRCPSRGLCPCPGTGPAAQHPGLRARSQALLPKRLPGASAPSQASRPPLHFKEHPQALTPVQDSSGAPFPTE